MHTDWSSMVTTSSDRFLTAKCRADLPRFVSWQLTLAPFSTNNSTLFTFIAFTAICSGVNPKSFDQIYYFPLLIHIKLILCCWMLTCVISGVQIERISWFPHNIIIQQ